MQLNGVLLIDKPAGLTSHQVVEQLRLLTSQQSIGHTGTLDPMATGLLLLCLGKATLLTRFFLKCKKEYIGELLLGRTSDTYDTDGEVSIIDENPTVERHHLLSLFDKMIGVQWQRPPIYSAVRVKGKRLYAYARRGEHVKVPKRQIEIYELVLLEYQSPKVKFRAVVSSGTYLRSVAHSIGEELGCGAVLSALRRTRICSFCVDEALKIDTQMSLEKIRRRLIKIFDACEFLPRAMVNAIGVKKLAHGQSVSNKEVIQFPEKILSDKEEVLLFDEEKDFVAIAQAEQLTPAKWVFSPKRVAINK